MRGMKYSRLRLLTTTNFRICRFQSEVAHCIPERTSTLSLWLFPKKCFILRTLIDKLAPALFRLGAFLGLPTKDETIIRYFITTGSAFRHFVREKGSEFDPKLLATMMSLPFAQFIWIVEFATESQWAVGQVAARAVIDATASLREVMPLWLLHSRTRAQVFNRQTVSLDLQTGMSRI